VAFGTKTNERPGTRAQVRYVRTSAYKAREVLDLIRGLSVSEAADMLRMTERGVATPIAKLLASAVANAEHNDEQDPTELYVSACYADEGPTLKRWRPRARGRATRIRKRTCHITIIVSRMSPDMLARQAAKASAAAARGGAPRDAAASRRARVAKSRGDAVDETAAEEIPGEPTDDTIEAAEEAVEAAAEDATETDETADEVGEPTETMVEEAEESAAASEPEASDAPGGHAKGGEAPLDAQDAGEPGEEKN
jgi:large subunit ribosomal protein L22